MRGRKRKAANWRPGLLGKHDDAGDTFEREDGCGATVSGPTHSAPILSSCSPAGTTPSVGPDSVARTLALWLAETMVDATGSWSMVRKKRTSEALGQSA